MQALKEFNLSNRYYKVKISRLKIKRKIILHYYRQAVANSKKTVWPIPIPMVQNKKINIPQTIVEKLISGSVLIVLKGFDTSSIIRKAGR